MTREDGLVDPLDPAEVAPVLAAALAAMGVGGVVDLLVRLPGVHLEEARPKRLFSPAVPGLVHLGEEHRLSLGDPVLHEHVVGGVVLARDPLPGGDLPGVLARLVAELVRREAAVEEAAVALSAVRDATGSF